GHSVRTGVFRRPLQESPAARGRLPGRAAAAAQERTRRMGHAATDGTHFFICAQRNLNAVIDTYNRKDGKL
ncbi:hypothetical protein, partial [Eisenbergiella tayi]|uniref:hypothetical protein n=1 Tax=Eisenbergiella tayi TaxID=1432052 RepID=UPI0022E06C80